jgi:hypothetical protein
MAQGLDKPGRRHIRDLCKDGADPEDVRDEIKRLLLDSDWNYSENVDLVKWLRNKSWYETAQYLENKINAGERPCFPGDAKVLTPRGFREIASFEVGDEVLSWDASASELRVARTTKMISHPFAKLSIITFANERPPLRATRAHSLLTQRGWRKVGKLSTDYYLTEVYPRLRMCPIASVLQSEDIEVVYNLITTVQHNVIIEGFVAHNFSHLRQLRMLVHRLFLDGIADIQVPLHVPCNGLRANRKHHS